MLGLTFLKKNDMNKIVIFLLIDFSLLIFLRQTNNNLQRFHVLHFKYSDSWICDFALICTVFQETVLYLECLAYIYFAYIVVVHKISC